MVSGGVECDHEHVDLYVFFFLMIRRPPRSTLDRSSAASDVYKRQQLRDVKTELDVTQVGADVVIDQIERLNRERDDLNLSLIHISEPTRPY